MHNRQSMATIPWNSRTSAIQTKLNISFSSVIIATIKKVSLFISSNLKAICGLVVFSIGRWTVKASFYYIALKRLCFCLEEILQWLTSKTYHWQQVMNNLMRVLFKHNLQLCLKRIHIKLFHCGQRYVYHFKETTIN